MTLDLNFGTREAATKGAWLHLVHPVSAEPLYDGPDQPVRWLIAGKDSEQYQRKLNDQQTRRIADSAKTKVTTLTGERFTAEALDLMAGCVLEVEHSVFAGQPLLNNFEAIRAVLKKEPWIAEQVDAFLMDRAGFLGASKQT
jgi:hypothetical protein